MAHILLEVPVDGAAPLIVEVEPDEVGTDLALSSVDPGRIAGRATTTLDESLGTLQPVLKAILARLRSVGPEEVAVTFGLKFGGESGMILAKGTAEVNLNVTMTWRRQERSV